MTTTTTIGDNPLVQQTLQYFSEFDNGLKPVPKPRKPTPSPPPPQLPPKPPSRDLTARVLVNGLPIDRYQQMLSRQQQQQSYFDKENYDGYNGVCDRMMMWSPNTEVRHINEGLIMLDHEGYGKTCPVIRTSPLRESANLVS